MLSYATRAFTWTRSLRLGGPKGVKVGKKGVNGQIVKKSVAKFKSLPLPSSGIYKVHQCHKRSSQRFLNIIQGQRVRLYSNEGDGEEEMRSEAINEALKEWTDLQFLNASSILQNYLNRPKPPSKLQHIHVLEDQQVYLYFSSLLFSQGRIQEAADNYLILTDAAKIQLKRWLELMTLTEQNIAKSPPKDGNPDRRTEYVNQLKNAWIELRMNSAAHHHDYAKMLEFLGATLEAQKAYETALELYGIFKENDPILFSTLQAGLSMLYEHLGNYKVALPLHEASLRTNTRVDRFDHPHVATMLHHIHTLQDTPAERTRLESILDKSDSKWRETLSSTPKTKENVLDDVLASSASPSPPSESLSLETPPPQIVESESLEVEPTEPDTWSTEDVLEILKQEANEEAAMLRVMLESQRPALGNIHMALLPGLLQLATMERRIGNFDVSLALLTEALHIVHTLKGPEHCDYATVLMHKSIHHHAADELTEAEIASRQALSIKEELLGIDHLHVGLIQYDLALILSKRSLHKESFTYFQASFAVFQQHLFADHPYTVLVKTTLQRAEELSYRQTIEDTRAKLGNNLNPSSM